MTSRPESRVFQQPCGSAVTLRAFAVPTSNTWALTRRQPEHFEMSRRAGLSTRMTPFWPILHWYGL